MILSVLTIWRSELAVTYSSDGAYFVTAIRNTFRSMKAPKLYVIALMLRSPKTVAFCRRVISARRGCVQLPGLSVVGTGFLLGVERRLEELRDLLTARDVVEDMLVLCLILDGW